MKEQKRRGMMKISGLSLKWTCRLLVFLRLCSEGACNERAPLPFLLLYPMWVRGRFIGNVMSYTKVAWEESTISWSESSMGSSKSSYRWFGCIGSYDGGGDNCCSNSSNVWECCSEAECCECGRISAALGADSCDRKSSNASIGCEGTCVGCEQYVDEDA